MKYRQLSGLAEPEICSNLRRKSAHQPRDRAPAMEKPLVPNKKTIEAMKEARRGNLPSYSSVDELMADLDAED